MIPSGGTASVGWPVLSEGRDKKRRAPKSPSATSLSQLSLERSGRDIDDVLARSLLRSGACPGDVAVQIAGSSTRLVQRDRQRVVIARRAALDHPRGNLFAVRHARALITGATGSHHIGVIRNVEYDLHAAR